MASSGGYWRFTEDVKDELTAIAQDAADTFVTLENTDDPADAADGLAAISKRLDKLNAQLGPAIPVLRKASTALEAVPSLKGT